MNSQNDYVSLIDLLSNSQIVNIFPFRRERFRRDLGRISYHRNLLFNLERGKKRKKRKRKEKRNQAGILAYVSQQFAELTGPRYFSASAFDVIVGSDGTVGRKRIAVFLFLPVGIVLSNICLGRSNFINTYSLFSVWCTCSRTRVQEKLKYFPSIVNQRIKSFDTVSYDSPQR